MMPPDALIQAIMKIMSQQNQAPGGAGVPAMPPLGAMPGHPSSGGFNIGQTIQGMQKMPPLGATPGGSSSGGFNIGQTVQGMPDMAQYMPGSSADGIAGAPGGQRMPTTLEEKLMKLFGSGGYDLGMGMQ